MHIMIILLSSFSVATVGFSSDSYRYNEATGRAQVNVKRSGNEDTLAVVLVASDSSQGTATGINEFYK